MAGHFKARDEFISGLTMTIAFGALWIFLGSGFWVFPMVFAGIIPLVRGGFRYFSHRKLPGKRNQELLEEKTVNIERAILSVAKAQKGRITPALVALNTNASLEDAQSALEDMVKHGYASMDVRDNGTVEYVFQEFLP
ncbi:MAG: hypothetical protein JW852_09430 [Spirochaetales bacterium]|nr:hypothetical protein [Spirochaetales bacterium]